MLIRKRRWLLVTALYVLGPIAGLMLGVFGGLYLVDKSHDDIELGETMAIEAEETDDGIDDVTSDATVTMIDGTEASLDEMAPGMNLAVVVMKDADCPVCQRQLKRMSDDLRAFQRRGGTVLGLSDADVETNYRQMKRLDLSFPVASDADHELLGELEMTLPERPHVMPGILFVDENGDLEHVHEGRQPGQIQERMVIDWLERS